MGLTAAAFRSHDTVGLNSGVLAQIALPLATGGGRGGAERGVGISGKRREEVGWSWEVNVMNERIVIDPKTCHGKPVIRGTRGRAGDLPRAL